MKIKEMVEYERPREKLINKGINYLSNAELLAIIIRTGNKKYNALQLSQNILKKCDNGLSDLRNMSIEEMCKIEGIGYTKASMIKSAIELGLRTYSEIPKKYKITNPWDIYEFYAPEMRYLNKEVFKVVLLNTKNEIITDIDVSIGSLNSSIVHPREVFVEAIRRSSCSMILMHNHPSGNPTPSNEDYEVTTRLIESSKIIGIQILDHIIIGNGEYYSFKENGIF